MNEKSMAARALPVLGALLVLLLLATGASLYLERGAPGMAGAGSGAELAALSQRLPQLGHAALAGDADRFGELERGARRLQGMAADADGAAARDRAGRLAEQAAALTAQRDPVLAAHAAAGAASERLPAVESAVAALWSAIDADTRAASGRDVERVSQSLSGIAGGLAMLAGGTGGPEGIGSRLDTLIAEAEAGLERLAGIGAGAEFDALQAQAAGVLAAAADGRAAADGVAAARTALASMSATGSELYPLVSVPAEAAAAAGAEWLTWALLAASFAVLIGLAVLYWRARDLRRAAEIQAAQNERNQQAILRLLDELGSLADGDLTVQATVTEDITGAIADSINYAIDALRELVQTINDSSILVDAAAKQTETTAGQLARSSERQSRQVNAASDSINQVAASIEEVSGNAERAADVARHSVDVAHKGGDAVRRTIEGMNTIRETIQETSKRIKRLGESSQEIGNIVELINDIAEQTNILALNASIQASMAGEAGRGFAVVADEVQRLAERSANATKQIEVLVRTIQSDTNEAVVSMERSTTDVVGGALLAENAGAALEEIEQVSNQIASLVQNISSSSRQQTSAAGDITRNMGVLREISRETAQSTSTTSSAIRKLSELASQLRHSVAGFRLPDMSDRPRMSETQIYRRIQPEGEAARGAGDAPAEDAAAAAGSPDTGRVESLQRQSG